MRWTPHASVWVSEKVGPRTGANLAALLRALFRSNTAGTVWGTSLNWMKEGLGLSTKGPLGEKVPGFFRMAVSGGYKKHGIGFAMAGLPMLWTGYHAYQGYQEGGIGGAAKGVATASAYNLAFGAAWGGIKAATGYGGYSAAEAVKMTGMSKGLARQLARASGMGGGSASLLNPIGVGIAATYLVHKGIKAWGDIGGKAVKGLRRLEMGMPVTDTFGRAATMRQRSLMAMQRSAINGRYAYGAESSVMHNG